jgi:hypothetical protein
VILHAHDTAAGEPHGDVVGVLSHGT